MARGGGAWDTVTPQLNQLTDNLLHGSPLNPIPRKTISENSL